MPRVRRGAPRGVLEPRGFWNGSMVSGSRSGKPSGRPALRTGGRSSGEPDRNTSAPDTNTTVSDMDTRDTTAPDVDGGGCR